MRTTLAVLVLFGLFTAPLRAANTPSKFAKEHQAAAELLHEKKWDKAAAAYRKILARGPRDSLAPNAQYGLFLAIDGAAKKNASFVELLAIEQLVKSMKAEGKLSGQQPIEAWMFRVRSEAGRLHEAGKKYIDAAHDYQRAAAEIGTKPQLADWRARAYINAARCLQQAKQTDVAIELLRKYLPELNHAKFAGMRAFQTTMLAKLHADASDSDAADELLAGLKNDPEIDDSQLAAARAMAFQGRRNDDAKNSDGGEGPSNMMRTRRGKDYLAIESVGRFEIRIALQDVGRSIFDDNRYGWIMAWYNLEEDPFKTRNLASLSYFPLIKPHHLTWLERHNDEWKRIDNKRYKEYSKTLDVNLGMQKGPSFHQKGSVKFEVLEDTPTRVRTRTSHDRWPFESMEYTFYPTGQIFVSANFDVHHKDPELRIGSVSFYTSKNAQFNWRDSTDKVSRMSGEGGGQFPTSYILSHSNSVPSFHLPMPDDILTCSAEPHVLQTFINNEITLMWRRTPLRFVVDRNLEEKSFALQMRVFPRNIDSFATGLPYVKDYQQPTKLSVATGKLVRDDRGDLDGDGYNESQGCFVVASDDGKLSATLDATGRPCFQPAFKITDWTGGRPELVTINGRSAGEKVNANLSIVNDTLIVQLLTTLVEGKTTIEIGGKASEAKAVKFQLDKWVYDDQRVTVRDSEQYKGAKEMMHSNSRSEGTGAYLRDLNFTDGVIECDMAGGAYLGISFRVIGDGEGDRKSEDIYFRINTDQRAGTVQYYPHGRQKQEELHRPPYERRIRRIDRGEWFHVRIEVSGKQAKAYLDNQDEPVIVIDDLMHDHAKGSVGLRSWGGVFANLKIDQGSRVSRETSTPADRR